MKLCQLQHPPWIMSQASIAAASPCSQPPPGCFSELHTATSRPLNSTLHNATGTACEHEHDAVAAGGEQDQLLYARAGSLVGSLAGFHITDEEDWLSL
jgi:hypothetical protein